MTEINLQKYEFLFFPLTLAAKLTHQQWSRVLTWPFCAEVACFHKFSLCWKCDCVALCAVKMRGYRNYDFQFNIRIIMEINYDMVSSY